MEYCVEQLEEETKKLNNSIEEFIILASTK